MFQFAREGYPFIIVFAALTAVAALLRVHWMTPVFLILTLFMFYFFRDPERTTVPDRNAFYSPADGKIIVIGEAEENEVLDGKALKISIFMSPLNVHVNRSPCDGVVREVKYYPGKFFNAYTDEASIKNEHITMLLEGGHGKIVVKQIAGSVARRAVCRVRPGETLKQGQRYGIIKFSSRLDVFLPLNTAVKVKLNDKVKAGETVLGIIK
jgi:phosphatidylserine decarboxylase